MYDVSAFGAAGDGAADDTGAIRAAIARASASGGGTVFFPAGVYRISAALGMASYVSYRGEGVGVSTIRQTLPTAHGFTGDSLEFVKFEDLMLDGPGSGTGIGISVTDSGGEATIGMYYLSMRNVLIRRFHTAGIYLEDAVMCDLTNVTCKESTTGFHFLGGGTSVTLTSCYAHHNTGNGFRLADMSYCALIGCGADDNTHGYKTEAVSGLTFTSCGAEANSGNGWHITAASKAVALTSCFSNTPGGVPFHITGNSTATTLITPVQGADPGSAAYFIHTTPGCTRTHIVNPLPGPLPAADLAPGTTT